MQISVFSMSFISFFVYVTLGVGFALNTLPLGGAESNLAVTNALKLRGVAKLGKHWDFSLHDSETGTFFWLGLNEEKYGIKIMQFDEQSKTLTVQNGYIKQFLTLEESLGDSYMSIHGNNYADGSETILSNYNKKLLEKYSLLIKEDDSKFRDTTAQMQLKALLETNPSAEDLSKYLEQNTNKIDWNEFSKIKYEGIRGKRLKR